MRFPQAAPVSLANSRERRKLRPPPPSFSPSTSGPRRAKKKHKRLDAIRDRVIEPEQRDCGEHASAGDPNFLRRGTRQRRPPILIDFSPSPVKKTTRVKDTANSLVKKKNDESVDAANGSTEVGSERIQESLNADDFEEMANWRSRLRSRVRNAGRALKAGGSPVRGKRKLFEESNGFGNEYQLVRGRSKDNPNNGLGRGTKLRRKHEGKMSVRGETENRDKGFSNSNKACKDRPMEAHFSAANNAGGLPVEKAIDGGSAESYEREDMPNAADVQFSGPVSDLPDRRDCEPVDGQCKKDNGDDSLDSKASEETDIFAHPSGSNDQMSANLDNFFSNTTTVDNAIKVNQPYSISDGMILEQPHSKEGRRCGLCGGGTDGRPPKMLVRDSAESDHEVYGGSWASEEPNYDVWDGFGDEPEWLGPLLGPIHDRFGIAGVWVHQHCAVWSPEVYFAALGCLKNVRAALCRGRLLKCSRCGRPGATIGCRVDRCPKTYHLPCSRADGCIFDHRKFLIACIDHRRLFQPQGGHYLHQISKMKAKKMRMGMRKQSNDAWRKDFEAEEKWLENCGEDEEFLRREGRRLHRDLNRIAPVYIGGSSFDAERSYQGWESVAGLEGVIQSLKEVVILPLLYPEFFTTLGLTPPRGVLLHGYPGTGKTLVVRALIGACSRGDKRIAYFARKGADCLGKYVGDAERQLRLLFQVAERSQPSIIFFDEIDGLAPRRSRQQDQTHSSVVSTLLALLDGLKPRGSVIVIGATNRPEAVDPALRRPGRFDREIYFPLPSANERSAILALHTRRWPKPLDGSLLAWIAERTPGFAGADLQSLCTQAAMIALKRSCHLQNLLSNAEKSSNHGRCSLPSFVVDERDWMAALTSAPPPCSRREAGIAASSVGTLPLHSSLISCLLLPLSYILISLYLDERIQLPQPLYKAAKLLNNVIVFALERKKIPNAFWSTHLHSLIKDPDIMKKMESKLYLAGLLMDAPCSSSCDSSIDDDGDCVNEEPEFHKLISPCANKCLNSVYRISRAQDIKSRFRLLVTGSPRCGQKHLAACLLHGFTGHVEILKVNSATISQEGRGDLVEGITRILLKCLSTGQCVIYMPRIDLWAVKGVDDKSDGKESDGRFCESSLTEHANCLENASDAWNIFVEQVDSLCLSSSVMILATYEMPHCAIPLRIKQFFMNDASNKKEFPSSEHSVPQFLVQVDGNFGHEMIINSSTAKLLQDLVQQYIQLIHHQIHKCNSNTAEKVKVVDNMEIHSKVQCQKDGESHVVRETVVSEGIPSSGSIDCEVRIQQPKNNDNRSYVNSSSNRGNEGHLLPRKDDISKICPSRLVKGRVATFGYQILRYPHFAELCWETSKLKDGPCTGINGPWKGWPFNSCIIHAEQSMEKEIINYCVNSHKSRERSCVVRGLVAVGLLAYRGIYNSIREVSLEVRKVLELLVCEINMKIQGGRDRWRFLRLLSQIAYFEDMVNSWTYGLQSLDMEQRVSTSTYQPMIETQQDKDGHAMITTKECVLATDDENEKAANFLMPESSPTRFSNGCHRSVDPHKDTHFDTDNSQAKTAISECPSREMRSLNSYPAATLPTSTAVYSRGSRNRSNELNNFDHLECSIEDPLPSSVLFDGVHSVKQPNDSDACFLEVSCNPNDSTALDNSISSRGSDQFNGMSSGEMATPSVLNRSKPVGGTDSNESNTLPHLFETCFYKCCSQCLRTVQNLVHRVLTGSIESRTNCTTLEDVYDAIAASSVNVLSASRKYFFGEKCINQDIVSCTMLNRVNEGGEHCACQDVDNLGVKDMPHLSKISIGVEIVPMNCICHSEGIETTATKKTFQDSHFGVRSQFFFKDSVLLPSDPGSVSEFHCKFENLCLCPVIKRILTMEAPLVDMI